MVGAERFELPTLWSQTRCATRLRYAPTVQEEGTVIATSLRLARGNMCLFNLIYTINAVDCLQRRIMVLL